MRVLGWLKPFSLKRLIISSNDQTMKKGSDRITSKGTKSEYRLDYSASKPNRFAPQIQDGSIVVLLDPDVGAVFRNSESVNHLLRSVIAALPEPRKKKR